MSTYSEATERCRPLASRLSRSKGISSMRGGIAKRNRRSRLRVRTVVARLRRAAADAHQPPIGIKACEGCIRVLRAPGSFEPQTLVGTSDRPAGEQICGLLAVGERQAAGGSVTVRISSSTALRDRPRRPIRFAGLNQAPSRLHRGRPVQYLNSRSRMNGTPSRRMK
jgi:hypothetical protein